MTLTNELEILDVKIKANTAQYDLGREASKISALQNIAISHSVDIYYKDFMKIYRKCAKEPFNFLTIDTTLTASNPLRSRKN